ncbi:hypothetical protein E0H56_04370 [Rhizobium leguminosarum bv. viciae]|uniref:DEAD/DEAH box helicase n=1 Tax=Rhizobium leguminosarum TaxID=384 RepID=UPI00103D53C5|nr:ATP-binding domain-containing protein [Rhizobium leguminosarum]TBZ96334.1 hypothetical protein E0H56_04370 [Rhizobium leguminosarum bv. viciae]
MELNTTPQRLREDPPTEALVSLIQDNADALKLSDASIYYKFPLYKNNEEVVAAKIIIVSPNHGVFVVETTNVRGGDYNEAINKIDEELDLVFGQLHGRLTKNRSLRRDKKNLKFNLEPMIFAPQLPTRGVDIEAETVVVRDRSSLRTFLSAYEMDPLSADEFREICSVLEGAKGLIVPRPRELDDLPENSRASKINSLEAEIASFDKDQKHGYMEVFAGPQRIRGLAGSGKTVVLAMKAALTHLRYPDATIVYTFYTRSLYQHVKRLITRFYRQYDDQDPDWDKLHIMHAWGGRGRAGVYYEACRSHGVTPLTYSDVSDQPSPFDFVCSNLIERTDIKQSYDYVFVDEGQDFPASFLRLCLALARESKFVYAYDELQNIFQAEIPSVESVFGEGFKLQEDIILKKCYRNPREVLVAAHSIGFGIYGDKIVQMLENADHWKDLGYELKGELAEGKEARILRPEANSPSSISKTSDISEIIRVKVCAEVREEMAATAQSVVNDVQKEGLKPEDIVVLCADDRYAKRYFSALTVELAKHGIATNNLSGDSYSGDVFTRENAVTLTSVHRAKGNEGYSVYVMGIDALFNRPSVRTRNLAFTAMTRAKAWLTITGLGDAAARFAEEIDKAKKNFPYMIFEYPGEERLKVMKRDLEETPQQRLERALEGLTDEVNEEVVKAALTKIAASRKKVFK